MKTEALSTFALKFAVGIATAATLAGGSAIVSNTKTNAEQTVQLQQHAEALKKIDTLSTKMDELNTNVVVLNDRLNREVERHEPRQ